MGILLWIIFGSLVGFAASKVLKVQPRQRYSINILIGIIGALIGGWFMSIIGNTGGIIAFNVFSFSAALLGAAALVAGPQALHRLNPRHL